MSGGAILNYSIDSDLVNGLLDYSNGSIVGIQVRLSQEHNLPLLSVILEELPLQLLT